MTIVSGDFTGNYFNAGAGYDLNEKYGIRAKISSTSVAPNYNFLLYQSDYVNYNWQNNFDNTETQKIQVNIKARKIAEVEASYATTPILQRMLMLQSYPYKLQKVLMY